VRGDVKHDGNGGWEVTGEVGDKRGQRLDASG
jgi:hypothetical protein